MDSTDPPKRPARRKSLLGGGRRRKRSATSTPAPVPITPPTSLPVGDWDNARRGDGPRPDPMDDPLDAPPPPSLHAFGRPPEPEPDTVPAPVPQSEIVTERLTEAALPPDPNTDSGQWDAETVVAGHQRVPDAAETPAEAPPPPQSRADEEDTDAFEDAFFSGSQSAPRFVDDPDEVPTVDATWSDAGVADFSDFDDVEEDAEEEEEGRRKGLIVWLPMAGMALAGVLFLGVIGVVGVSVLGLGLVGGGAEEPAPVAAPAPVPVPEPEPVVVAPEPEPQPVVEQPEPEPVAAVAATSPEPKAKTARAKRKKKGNQRPTVSIAGDMPVEIWFVRGSQRFPPGPLDPGVYVVEAAFVPGPLNVVGEIDVPAGTEPIRIRCSKGWGKCR